MTWIQVIHVDVHEQYNLFMDHLSSFIKLCRDGNITPISGASDDNVDQIKTQ